MSRNKKVTLRVHSSCNTQLNANHPSVLENGQKMIEDNFKRVKKYVVRVNGEYKTSWGKYTDKIKHAQIFNSKMLADECANIYDQNDLIEVLSVTIESTYILDK